MFVFLFIMACAVFITTITWLSYQLGANRPMGASKAAIIGFVLSFVPPLALIYIAYLAFFDTRAKSKRVM